MFCKYIFFNYFIWSTLYLIAIQAQKIEKHFEILKNIRKLDNMN